MKKRIVCLAVLLVMVLSLASCIVSKNKYDYNMEKYITLVDYNGYKVDLELDSIQAAIDSSIMDYSSEYVITKMHRTLTILPRDSPESTLT